MIVLMRSRGWTVEEMETLKNLYPTFGTFRELLDRLPGRSPNSVRLMASRLGIHRPSLLPNIERAEGFGIRPGNETYVKCSRCKEWFVVSPKTTKKGGVVACSHCGCYSFVSD